MYYFLLGSLFLEFDQYLAVYIFFSFSIAISTSKELGSGTLGSAVCITVFNIISAMYTQYLTEVILLSVQNIVRICKQIISHILPC
jgi:hypothetical protein